MTAKDILKQLQELINRLECDQERILEPMNEVANKQGSDEMFVYYTLDKEMYSHRPHVHICIPINNKRWQGKYLNAGSPYKTVGSVFIDAKITEYTPENIEFETIVDPKIQNTKCKKVICRWLNSNNKLGVNNALKCLDDYLTNNEIFANKEEFEKSLNRRLK